MSESVDVGHIRELHAAVGRGDFQALSTLVHPDVVWEHNLGLGSPEEGVYRGRESVIALHERILEAWRYVRPVALEIRSLGPGSYLINGELHAKHGSTQAEIVTPYEQALDLRDGLLVKGRMSTGGTLGLDDGSGSDAAGDSPNVATVRRISDAFNRLDLDAVVGDLDPEVELSEWPTAPGAQTYRGRVGVRQALATWFEAWEWMQHEIKNFLEAGDRVFVTAHQRAKGRGSAVQVGIESYNVYTFRDAKVIRIELFTEREPALHAAGLTPNPEEAKR